MKFLQLVALSQTFLVTEGSRRINERIIGGKEMNSGRFPYAVALADDIGQFCGGSLIAEDVVLTAAHCQGGKYNAIVGKHDLTNDESGEVIPIDYELPHPDYDDRTTNNDFNLVFLSRPVNNSHIVTLNSQDNAPEAGDSVFVMGWGDTAKEDDIQTISDVLMGVEVKMMTNEDCESSQSTVNGYKESYQGQITPSMMCAKDINEDSCQGDSGGPLVTKGRNGSADLQVGVVSWGIGCAHHSFPGVYARVSTAYGWIKKEVCARSSSPPASFNCASASSSLALEYGNQALDTSSAASQFVASLHQKKGFRGSQQMSTLMEEDFTSGYTFFHNSIAATLYHTAKGRSGVVRLSDGASLSSKQMPTSFARFQVLLSFQFNDMKENNGLCLDYSDDNGATWKEFACHRSSATFTNDVWYENVSTDFKPSEPIDSLAIRLRASETQGITLLDRVTIKGMTQ